MLFNGTMESGRSNAAALFFVQGDCEGQGGVPGSTSLNIVLACVCGSLQIKARWQFLHGER